MFLATATYMAAVGLAAYFLLAFSRVQFPPPIRFDGANVTIHPRTFWILWLGFLFGTFSGVMVLGHAATIVGSLGGSVGAMTFGTSLVAVGNGLGRFFGSWLSDRLPARWFLSLVLLAGGAGLLAIIGFPQITVALLALLTLGLGYGAMAGSYPMVISHIYGIAMVSRVYGRVFTAWGIAGVMSPLLAGALFDRAGDYRMAIVLGACAAICAGLTCLALPATRPIPRGGRYPAS
jgi:OFA family oxalate/formate antiporter-like MFS transporter